MTPAELDLARALVAAPWWEWRPGMRAVDARTGGDAIRICWVTDTGVGHGWDETDAGAYERHAEIVWTEAGDVPDLHDQGTQGGLIGLLLDGTSADVRLTWAHSVDGVPGRSLEARWMGWTWRGDPAQILARALLAVRS